MTLRPFPFASPAPKTSARHAIPAPLLVGALVGTLCLSSATLAQKPTAPATASSNPIAVIDTSMGEITIELFADKAPVSTQNFITYANAGHYNTTVFHRVLKNYIVQGGGYDQSYQRKTTRDPIKNEAENGLKNRRGTLSMARTRIVDSGTAQFFVNIIDNPNLDHVSSDSAGFGYAVFGKVTSGMHIVDRIANLPTGACGTTIKRDCPKDPVFIKTVRIDLPQAKKAEGAAQPDVATKAEAKTGKPATGKRTDSK